MTSLIRQPLQGRPEPSEKRSVSGKDKGDEDGDPFSCVECPWCPKAFKGIQYVVRHVQTKHSRNLVAVASGYVAICPSII